jgi:hypothetical protein
MQLVIRGITKKVKEVGRENLVIWYEVRIERMERQNILQEIKNYLSKIISLVPFGVVLKGKIGLLISLLFSSVFAYMAGYLFLWGYYFGGNGDFSLITAVVNYIPINRSVVVMIGLFYLLSIFVAGLSILSIIREKVSTSSVFFMTLSLALANLALVLFFHGETSVTLFLTMLRIWFLPLIVIIVIGYRYVWMVYPVTAVLSVLYFCSLFLNLSVTSIVIPFQYNDHFLSPEIFTLLIYIGLPLSVIVMKIEQPIAKTAVKFILYLTAMVPLVPMLLLLYLKSKVLITITSIVVIVLAVFIVESSLYKGRLRKKDKPKVSDIGKGLPFFLKRPIQALFFFVAAFFFIFVLLPNILIKGGDYFHSVIGPDNYREITYIWQGESKTITGILVSTIDDSLYISTRDQRMVIIKAKEVLIRDD